MEYERGVERNFWIPLQKNLYPHQPKNFSLRKTLNTKKTFKQNRVIKVLRTSGLFKEISTNSVSIRKLNG